MGPQPSFSRTEAGRYFVITSCLLLIHETNPQGWPLTTRVRDSGALEGRWRRRLPWRGGATARLILGLGHQAQGYRPGYLTPARGWTVMHMVRDAGLESSREWFPVSVL